MSSTIHILNLGTVNCYLIRGKAAVLVDAGGPGKAGRILKMLAVHGVAPDQVRLMVMTHGHWDHVGSARDLKEATGARLAMHEAEQGWLEGARKVMPPGVTARGRFMNRVGSWLLPLVNFPATGVDLVVGGEDFPLTDFGVEGRIIHTPGHSPGSISVLLDTGDCFVGDAAMNGWPMRRGPGLPILAEDLPLLKAGWRRLLDLGARTIYPGHGRPFPASAMESELI
jgi:glyoxylase-like metal-dependent hydrolase (beta-lactamase superfamily II)